MRSQIKKLIFTLFFLITMLPTAFAAGANIGHGTVKAIKVYSNASPKFTKIYLNLDASNVDLPECNYAATITHNKYENDKAALNQMMSIVLSAYMANKKIRLWTSDDTTCEANMVSIQESYF